MCWCNLTLIERLHFLCRSDSNAKLVNEKVDGHSDRSMVSNFKAWPFRIAVWKQSLLLDGDDTYYAWCSLISLFWKWCIQRPITYWRICSDCLMQLFFLLFVILLWWDIRLGNKWETGAIWLQKFWNGPWFHHNYQGPLLFLNWPLVPALKKYYTKFTKTDVNVIHSKHFFFFTNFSAPCYPKWS